MRRIGLSVGIAVSLCLVSMETRATIPEMSLQEVIQDVARSPERAEATQELLKTVASDLLPQGELRERLVVEWLQAIQQFKSNPKLGSEALGRLHAFPTLRVSWLQTMPQVLRHHLSGGTGPQQVREFYGEDLQVVLGSYAGPCLTELSKPAVLNEKVPWIRRGYFGDSQLDPCVHVQSQVLSDILTSLSSGKGYYLTFEGECVESPEELLDILIRTGHDVTVANERMVANFTALVYTNAEGKDFNVRWPVWVDTELEVGGKALLVPAGHSHLSWFIRPTSERSFVSAQINFYMGIRGMWFYPQTELAPKWIQTNSLYQVTANEHSPRELKFVRDSLRVAGDFLERTLLEQSHFKLGAPSFGYGLLGICNDSQAVVHSIINDSTLTEIPDGHFPGYPLARSKAHILDADDVLTRKLKATPNDAVRSQTRGRQEVLRAIREMLGGQWTSGTGVQDMTLRSQLKLIDHELKVSKK